LLWLALRLVNAGPQEALTVRVMSYNIHHGAGNDVCEPPAARVPPAADCGLNLDRIAKVIHSRRPDIVALQEVDQFWGRSGGVDQAAYLARVLGMSPCVGMNLDHEPDAHSAVQHKYGTAILSRFPMRDCNNTLLPKAAPESEQRGLLTATVEVRGTNLGFLNTHLHTQAADRIAQLQRVTTLARSCSGPVVLTGDFNARPSETSLNPLRALLRDAWELKGAGSGFTLPAGVDRGPDRRIDYIWVSSGVNVAGIFVDVRPVTALASDHYPVVADIVLSAN
jgi:endonuclease/exonuclease/phosphatase family metal-dependent hydrolase